MPPPWNREPSGPLRHLQDTYPYRYEAARREVSFEVAESVARWGGLLPRAGENPACQDPPLPGVLDVCCGQHLVQVHLLRPAGPQVLLERAFR